MNMTIELPRIDAHALGQLFMMLQIATVYAGALYDVDPLDQPGVELGKQLTYALMGRPGFDGDRGRSPPHRSMMVFLDVRPAEAALSINDRGFLFADRRDRTDLDRLATARRHCLGRRLTWLRSSGSSAGTGCGMPTCA
jgi:hypothetical protein